MTEPEHVSYPLSDLPCRIGLNEPRPRFAGMFSEPCRFNFDFPDRPLRENDSPCDCEPPPECSLWEESRNWPGCELRKLEP